MNSNPLESILRAIDGYNALAAEHPDRPGFFTIITTDTAKDALGWLGSLVAYTDTSASSLDLPPLTPGQVAGAAFDLYAVTEDIITKGLVVKKFCYLTLAARAAAIATQRVVH